METSNIELLPGFKVIEHSITSTRLLLPSGFDITVTRLPPFMSDCLKKGELLEDPGPFKIIVLLMAKLRPPGVEQEIEYVPPSEEPDKDEFPEEYMYYHQFIAHEKKRRTIQVVNSNTRMDNTLLTCVTVNDGPVSLDDDDWLKRLEGRIIEPVTYSDRLLLFYKLKVLTSLTTIEVVRDLTIVEEVTMEGLLKAFDSFRSRMARDKDIRANRESS